MHAFAGWQLIPKRPCHITNNGSGVAFKEAPVTVEEAEMAVLARQCCHESAKSECRLLIAEDNSDNNSSNWLKVRESLARRGILCRMETNPSSRLLLCKWSYCDFGCMEYRLTDDHRLWVRERLVVGKRKRRRPLQELTSHHRHEGVDNTGQVCVWDSEITLTHLLVRTLEGESPQSLLEPLESMLAVKPPQKQPAAAPLSVVELGCGMAGLAGLALAKLRPNTRVLLTDGHPEAIRNNQIHVHLNEFADQSTVSCQQLLWTTTTDSNDDNDHNQQQQHDMALVSDCTHFQEHHAGLAWTLAQLLRVDGVAVLCQPPRGNSLKRFLELCRSMMNGSSDHHLWSIETADNIPMLDRHHQASLQNPHYNPDRHQPKVVFLFKLRDASDLDRRDAIQHMCQRETSVTSATD